MREGVRARVRVRVRVRLGVRVGVRVGLGEITGVCMVRVRVGDYRRVHGKSKGESKGGRLPAWALVK